MIKHVSPGIVVALAVAALFVACSDGGSASGDADTVACDCEPAEPPLAGRIVQVEERLTAATFGLDVTTACPDGATLLGGGCDLVGLGAVLLIQSGSRDGGPHTWQCSWVNESGSPDVTVVAWATCLLPAP
jgi:hypothetical protein